MAKKFNDLLRKMPIESQKKVAKRAQLTIEGILLAEMRKISGLTQNELADKMGVSQPALSQLEQQDDMQISTLGKLVNALGGHLEIIAHLPEKDLTISQFSGVQ
jgi:DNA-binding XRE family transcriptional regulator